MASENIECNSAGMKRTREETELSGPLDFRDKSLLQEGSRVWCIITGRPGTFMHFHSLRELFFRSIEYCRWKYILVHDGSNEQYVQIIEQRLGQSVTTVLCDYDGRIEEISERASKLRKKKLPETLPDYIHQEFNTDVHLGCWRQWFQISKGMQKAKELMDEEETKGESLKENSFVVRVRPDVLCGEALFGIANHVVCAWDRIDRWLRAGGGKWNEAGPFLRKLSIDEQLLCGGSSVLRLRYLEAKKKCECTSWNFEHQDLEGTRSQLFCDQRGASCCMGGAYMFDNEHHLCCAPAELGFSINDWIIVTKWKKAVKVFSNMHASLPVDSDVAAEAFMPGGFDTWAPEALLHHRFRSGSGSLAVGALAMHCGGAGIFKWERPYYPLSMERLLQMGSEMF